MHEKNQNGIQLFFFFFNGKNWWEDGSGTILQTLEKPRLQGRVTWQAKRASVHRCRIKVVSELPSAEGGLLGWPWLVALSSCPALAQSLCPQSKCPRSLHQLASHELPIIGDLTGDGQAGAGEMPRSFFLLLPKSGCLLGGHGLFAMVPAPNTALAALPGPPISAALTEIVPLC